MTKRTFTMTHATAAVYLSHLLTVGIPFRADANETRVDVSVDMNVPLEHLPESIGGYLNIGEVPARA